MDRHDLQDGLRGNALTSSSCVSCLSMFESLENEGYIKVEI